MTDVPLPGPWAEEPLNGERLDAARSEVARFLGRAMAEKATARFCLAFAGRRAPDDIRIQLESADERGVQVSGGGRPTVIEFVGEADTGERDLPAPPSGARSAAVAASRTRAYQTIGSVYAELERMSTGPLTGVRMAGGEPAVSALLNQVCWLNRTVRSFASPLALAEVAQDTSVRTFDVPRPLRAEAEDPNMVATGVPAWRATKHLTGESVIVAVIDAEVALRHPALVDRVVQRRNFTREGWGNPHPHGTGVAGVIGAAGNEHGGVAPGAVMYNYKVLAGPITAEDFAGATALQLALEDGAVVANCSWGAGPAGDGTGRMARAVDTAWALGMVVVKSAGNDGPSPGTLTSPADADGLIVVGATDLEGATVAEYSSRGPLTDRHGPHLVAPGGTTGAQIVSCHPGGGFAGVGPGTSFAAAHVSGMVALLAEANPDWDADALRQQLINDAVLLRGAEPAAQGFGLATL